MHKSIKDLTGQKFNMLTVIADLGERSGHNVKWYCLCDCGEYKFVSALDLQRGGTSSCGCTRYKRNNNHVGKRTTPEWVSWQAMKLRCLLKTNPAYRWYGGRGIKICKRWMVFENFLADMGPRPLGTTNHRFNKDGNYEPSNCMWSYHHQETERP